MPIIVLIGLAVLTIPLAKWWNRRRRMKRLEAGDITAAWEEIVTRLTDLGTPPDPSRTPVEAAADVDEAMKPLALVYSRVVYGEEHPIRDEQVRTAADSMHTTAFRLNGRYPAGRRLLAWYRVSRPRRPRKPNGRAS